MESSRIIAFHTEGNKEIGTGHVYECLSLARELKKEGFDVIFIVKANRELINIINDEIEEVEEIEYNQDYEKTLYLLRKYKVDDLVLNLRKIRKDYVDNLRTKGIKTIVIDELGNPNIKSDILINGSVVEEWHNYTDSKNMKKYIGPKYKILRNSFRKYNKKDKEINDEISKILVIMGGTDKSGTALRILDALSKTSKNITKKIILGSNFPFDEKIKKLKKSLKESNFEFMKNITNVAELMFKSDLVFSHASNTMYELASVGTPGIVFYEEIHEKKQAEYFEENGAVINLGLGTKANSRKILNTLKYLEDNPLKRGKMSKKGKKIIDGLGTKRIIKIIKN